MKSKSTFYSSLLVNTGISLMAISLTSAQTITWDNTGAGTAWYTNTSWDPDTAAAAWLTTNVAQFANAGTATTAGINMNTRSLSIAAIEVTSARTRVLTIGNSSSTTGSITLNSATVNGVANTVLRNASPNLLTLQNNETGSGKTMNVILNGTTNVFQIDGVGGITITSIISGVGQNLTLQGTGTGALTLGAANTYTGSTTIGTGTLVIDHLNALSNTSGITIGGASPATLSSTLTGITITKPITTANTGVSSTIAFGRTTSAAGSIILNGAIGGNGNVIFSTPSGAASANNLQSIDLGAAATYAGSTLITTANDNTTMRVRNTSGAVNALPTTTVLTMDGGVGPSGNFIRTVSYDLNGQNQTLAGLSNVARTKRNQTITNTGALSTLTINNGTDFTYGGEGTNGTVSWATTIAGAIALTKEGVGSQTLTGAHSYTGATAVNAGTLRINGSTSTNSAFTVAAAASLAGSGTVAGTVNVTGMLAPGNAVDAIGQLSTGSFTWNGGTGTGNQFQFNLGAASGSSDKLMISGDFTKAGDTSYVFHFMGSTPNTTGNVYTLAEWSGTTNFIAGNFSFAPGSLSGTFNTGSFSITGNQLQFTAVPEASNLFIGGLLGLGLMSRRRKNA